VSRGARQAWYAVEAIHDVVYFAPRAREAYEAVGITGWWRGYFASRAAALGTPSASLVSALFHGFAPDFVARHMSGMWTDCRPDEVLPARLELARERLEPIVGDRDVSGLVESLEAVVAGADLAGRPLAAAHAAVVPATDVSQRMWQLVTALREYRGDCHVAVLTVHGLGGAAANVLAEAAGLTDGRQQTVRGWGDDAWRDAHALLARRGWLDADGAITEVGRAARTAIEDETDEVTAAGVDETAMTTWSELLLELAVGVRESGMVPYPNPTAAPAAG